MAGVRGHQWRSQAYFLPTCLLWLMKVIKLKPKDSESLMGSLLLYRLFQHFPGKFCQSLTTSDALRLKMILQSNKCRKCSTPCSSCRNVQCFFIKGFVKFHDNQTTNPLTSIFPTYFTHRPRKQGP